MKKSILTILIAFITPTIFSASTPGCTRKNSDGIIRDLLFMHLNNGQLPFAISLLDPETMNLTDLSGNSVTKRLNELKDQYDIGPVLKHLKQLEEKIKHAEEAKKLAELKKQLKENLERNSNHPISDLPD